MPVFSRALEKTLRKALAIANERRHEYATLEHLLLALDRRSRRRGGAARLQRRSRRAAQERRALRRHRTREPGRRARRGGQGDRRLPACGAARGHPCAILGPRGGHRRQRTGRDLRRAREPRRLFPARAGHDPLRRGQLHQPRHRQAAGPLRLDALAARRRRGSGIARGQGRQGQRRLQEKGRRA